MAARSDIGYDDTGRVHVLCPWWTGSNCGQVGQTVDTKAGEVRLDSCSYIRSGAGCAVKGLLEEVA